MKIPIGKNLVEPHIVSSVENQLIFQLLLNISDMSLSFSSDGMCVCILQYARLKHIHIYVFIFINMNCIQM